jgi:alcohol dehydrogenase
MYALTFQGPDRKAWHQCPDPALIEESDAIIGVDTTTICGTDLHILRGDLPEVEPGLILGHEAVGTVEAVGSAVTAVRPGDRILVSCISACGRCRFCRGGRYGQCLGGGGWILGHTVDGTQAEYVRVPFADTSTYRLPETVPDVLAVMLSDVLPTAYEVGVLNGGVRPGDVVVVIGAGPIGLAAVLTAKFFTPASIVVVDRADARLDTAKRTGAAEMLNPERDDVLTHVNGLTHGLGADVVVEAVGLPETFELATQLVRPGGRLANVGVHGRAVSLHLERLWSRDITITSGLVDTFSTPDLMRMLAAGMVDVGPLVTHQFELADIEHAYDVFARPAESHAIKVVLSRA